VVAAGLGWYVVRHWQEFAPQAEVQMVQVLPLGLVTLAQFFFNGLLTRIFVGLFGVELSFREWFGLAAITAAGNYLAPLRGGMLGKAVYLRRRHGFPYADFAAVVTASYALLFLLYSAYGLLILGWACLFSGWCGDGRVWGFLAVVFCSLAVLLWASGRRQSEDKQSSAACYPSPQERPPRPTQQAARLIQLYHRLWCGWHILRRQRKVLAGVLLVMSANLLVSSLQLYLAYSAFGYPRVYAGLLLMSIFAGFSLLLSITPGNLGIHEALMAFLSQTFGMGFGEGLLAATLVRLVSMTLAFALGPLYSFLLLVPLREKP